MKVEETGVLINVKNYEACIEFYEKALELKVRLRKPHLTNFQFGHGYLLVEKADSKTHAVHHFGKNPITMRINVPDVQQAIWHLRAKEVEVEFNSYDWGDIGHFHDPDGNRLEFCKWK